MAGAIRRGCGAPAMSEAANRKLQSIRVRTEISSGNIPPLLHEIRHALAALSTSGTRNIIDLKGIPLAPGEQEVDPGNAGRRRGSRGASIAGQERDPRDQFPWRVGRDPLRRAGRHQGAFHRDHAHAGDPRISGARHRRRTCTPGIHAANEMKRGHGLSTYTSPRERWIHNGDGPSRP